MIQTDINRIQPTAAMTVGGDWSNAVPWTDGLGSTGYGYGYIQPYVQPHVQPYVQTITITAPPYSCSGECHVWGCEHAEKCKCGKATRKPEPKKCGCCGKTL